MAAIIQNITTLSAENTSAPNIVDIMYSFLFNNTDLKEYDPTKVYNTGDYIIEYNPLVPRFEVYKCLKSNTTGIFDSMYWEPSTLKNAAIGTSSIEDEFAIISMDEPTTLNNKLWYKAVSYRTSESSDPISLLNTVIVLAANEFVGQDDEPSDPNVQLWIDYEN